MGISKRNEIEQNAEFRSTDTTKGWAFRGESNSIAARTIADHLGIRIQYVCGVLNQAVEAGVLQRVGTRCKYTYARAAA